LEQTVAVVRNGKDGPHTRPGSHVSKEVTPPVTLPGEDDRHLERWRGDL
jgi:hypothetical protein